MKALIDPESPVTYTTGWTKIRGTYSPINTVIANSARVCQLELDENVFGVAEVLFWQDCSEEIIPDFHYFDTQDKQFKVIPQSALYPDQPVVEGTQTI